MKSFKKYVSLILCLAMVVCIGGCGKENNTSGKKKTSGQTSSDISSQTASVSEEIIPGTNPVYEDVWVPGEEEKSDRYIYSEEDSSKEKGEADIPVTSSVLDLTITKDYILIYESGNSVAKECAESLRDYFLSKYKFELTVSNDKKTSSAKEILVGNTNRIKEKCAEGDLFVKQKGKKLWFCGGHNVTLKKAVDIFVRLGKADGKIHAFSLSTDFVSSRLGYSYVWGDEFEGLTIDSKKWDFQTKMNATAEMVLDKTSKTIQQNNGYLKLFAVHNWDHKNAGAEYACPWSVTTMNEMSFKYGYVEMRARVPFIRGVWPSFWAVSAGSLGPKTKYDYTVEVDIFEAFSSVDTISSNIHKWYSLGDHTQSSDEDRDYAFNSDNLINEYHLYGMEWSPKEISMYIDGKKYKTFDLTTNMDDGASGMGGFDTQLHLILNNHLFTNSSSYKPYPDCEIYQKDLPAEYDVDWIRLYQKNDGISKLYTK